MLDDGVKHEIQLRKSGIYKGRTKFNINALLCKNLHSALGLTI